MNSEPVKAILNRGREFNSQGERFKKYQNHSPGALSLIDSGAGVMAISTGFLPAFSERNNPGTCLTSCNGNLSPLNSLKRSFGIPWRNSRQLPPSRLDMHQRSYKGFLMVTCESTVSVAPTEWIQRTFELPEFKRGCHIITRHIYEAVPEISQFEVGLANLFILHTSASLTINENASRDVPLDMEDSLNRIVPEGNHYRHLDEGYDDMPAHVKASMMGCSLTIPLRSGRFHLGIWQGIWLNEHRNYGGPRKICVTLQGKKRADGRINIY